MSAFCRLPEWIAFFGDTRLALVFAAHLDAERAPGEPVALTELQCAARTGLHRETVHKKKRQLIVEHKVLVPEEGASGRGWRGLPCRIDRTRLVEIAEPLPENRQLIAGKPTIETPPIAGKPTIETPPTAGKPTIETEQLTENRQLKTPHLYERAPAPASLDLASYSSQLAVLPPVQNPTQETHQEAPLEAAVKETIARTGLRKLGGTELQSWTLKTVCDALKPIAQEAWKVREVLDVLEHKCRDWLRHPAKAVGWGILVSVARAEAAKRAEEPVRRPATSSEDLHDADAVAEVADMKASMRAMAAGLGMR